MNTHQDLVKSHVIRLLQEIKKISPKSGVHYWRARDIMEVLGYDRWENFKQAITRAMESCRANGFEISQQFRETTKVLIVGNGAKLPVEDFFLTQYACYLTAMNGDTQKPQIAAAQAYFAIQTYRQEVQSSRSEEDQRIEVRERVLTANAELGKTAKRAGVHNFGAFNDSGYKGLYGGLSVSEIKRIKQIEDRDELLDCCNRTELAANEFRITQTQEKLERDRINGEDAARTVHYNVGTEIRNAISKIKGTMPENHPKEPSIKNKIAQRRRQRRRLQSGPSHPKA